MAAELHLRDGSRVKSAGELLARLDTHKGEIWHAFRTGALEGYLWLTPVSQELTALRMRNVTLASAFPALVALLQQAASAPPPTSPPPLVPSEQGLQWQALQEKGLAKLLRLELEFQAAERELNHRILTEEREQKRARDKYFAEVDSVYKQFGAGYQQASGLLSPLNLTHLLTDQRASLPVISGDPATALNEAVQKMTASLKEIQTATEELAQKPQGTGCLSVLVLIIVLTGLALR